MQLHLIIRKVNLSNLADYTCWGSPDALLALPLEDEKFLKLIDYLQAALAYKTYINEITSYEAGTGYLFFSNPLEPLVSYYVFGTVDVDMLINYLRKNDAYDDYATKRDILLPDLGWTLEEEKVVTIESNHVENTEEWSNLPTTFSEVADMYQNGISLTLYQGTNT
jgi:hypothetical protein